jgi:hypothetical protein
MKIKWDTKLLDLKAKPIKSDSNEDVTLSDAVCNSMIAVLRGDENLSGDEKLKLFKIAMAASNGADGEITVDQAALIKKRVAMAYGALIVGRVDEILEGGA